jgi:hypothetical protein
LPCGQAPVRLRAGRSLPQLLAQRRGVRNLPGTPPLTVETILAWADTHHDATGQWPRLDSGPVIGQPGETWNAVQAAHTNGARGLPGGSSLAQLLQEHRGARNKSRLLRQTIEQVLAWVDVHHERTGAYPHVEAGPIADAPGETWKAVQMALVQGLRGLPGGSSLAKLLKARRGAVS